MAAFPREPVLDRLAASGLVSNLVSEDLPGKHDHAFVPHREVGVPAEFGEQRISEGGGQLTGAF